MNNYRIIFSTDMSRARGKAYKMTVPGSSEQAAKAVLGNRYHGVEIDSVIEIKG